MKTTVTVKGVERFQAVYLMFFESSVVDSVEVDRPEELAVSDGFIDLASGAACSEFRGLVYVL